MPLSVTQRPPSFPPIGGRAIHPAHGLVGGQTPLTHAGIVICGGGTRQKDRRPDAPASLRPRTGGSNMDLTTTCIGGVPQARLAWVSKALCRTTDPDELFVSGKAQNKA